MLRTAAGRRALQLVLLVGGLFVLGFLGGEQAHAAEGAPVLPVTAARPVVPEPRDAARTVTGRLTTPVRDAVRTASRALEETRAGVPTLTALPSVPTVPLPTTRLPALPPLPTPPTTQLPTLPSPPATPVPAPRPPTAPPPTLLEGSGLPAQPLPAQTAPESRPHRNGGTGQAAGPGHMVRTEARTAVGARPSATAYGPHVAHPAAHPAAAPAALPAGAPAPPRPTGDPDGVLGKQAACGPAPRHGGDGCAVAPGGRALLRLLPAGTVARTDVPRTRERQWDVPVFPG